MQLRQGALEHRFVVFGQFRVGVVEVAVEVGEGELQAIFDAAEMHRRAKDLVPLMGIGRFRAAQINRQRRVITAESITAGAHIDRRERVDGFEGRCRVA